MSTNIINGLTAGTPISINCPYHGWLTGQAVYVEKCLVFAANGKRTITVTDPHNFTLDDTSYAGDVPSPCMGTMDDGFNGYSNIQNVSIENLGFRVQMNSSHGMTDGATVSIIEHPTPEVNGSWTVIVVDFATFDLLESVGHQDDVAAGAHGFCWQTA